MPFIWFSCYNLASKFCLLFVVLFSPCLWVTLRCDKFLLFLLVFIWDLPQCCVNFGLCWFCVLEAWPLPPSVIGLELGWPSYSIRPHWVYLRLSASNWNLSYSMCFSHCLLSLNNVHILVPQFYYNIIYLLNFKVLICPLPLQLYVNNIIGVNSVDLYVVTHMFVIIIRHYKGIHSATGGSLTPFCYPLCCICSAPCYSCVFQHLARYIDVKQNSPCPLAMLVICWVNLCVVISAGGFASISALLW